MSVLKGFGTGIISFLLLISLSVFGIAFLINSTLLNPDFIAGRVDELDMNSLAREYIDEQIGEDLSQEEEFIKEAVYDVINDQEPWLKEQLNDAVYTGYDFLLGKSDRFEINIPLDELKANIKISLWQTLQEFLARDAASIPQDLLMSYIDEHYRELLNLIPEEYLPPEIAGLNDEEVKIYIDQHTDEVASWIQAAYRVPGVSTLILDQIQPYFR